MIRTLAVLLGSAGAAWVWINRTFLLHKFSKPGWHVDYGQNEAHVWPCRDLEGHEFSEDCACGVQTMPIETPDGSIGWVYRHRAYDGRE